MSTQAPIDLHPTKTLIVATHNAGKLGEIAVLLAPHGMPIKGAKEAALPEPEETGTTFRQNAAIKAVAAAEATGFAALADDSGLCVDALDDAPGVYTADWAESEDGSGRDYPAAMRKVHDKLVAAGATEPAQRKARFVCTLCLAEADGRTEFFEGEVTGTLVWPPRGENGHGYDPMFQPDGYDKTFGEMNRDEKGGGLEAGRADLGLSHRSRALAAFIAAKFTEAP